MSDDDFLEIAPKDEENDSDLFEYRSSNISSNKLNGSFLEDDIQALPLRRLEGELEHLRQENFALKLHIQRMGGIAADGASDSGESLLGPAEDSMGHIDTLELMALRSEAAKVEHLLRDVLDPSITWGQGLYSLASSAAKEINSLREKLDIFRQSESEASRTQSRLHRLEETNRYLILELEEKKAIIQRHIENSQYG